MKVIYMEDVIMEMSKRDPKETAELIKSGVIKKTEEDKPYLVVEIEEEEGEDGI